MKLHLRTIAVRNACYRLVTLRPHTEIAFSTNYYHDTWHIVSDSCGARLLARLMWGLAYQRQPGTVVVVLGEHVQPTPFDAERSAPILLALADRAEMDRRRLGALHRRLQRLGPPQCTLRWHTFGLDHALEQLAQKQNDGARRYQDHDWLYWNDSKPLWNAEQMFRRGGFVCYCAPPAIMQVQALRIAQMDPGAYGMDYHYLAHSNEGHGADGEVQIFRDYDERRSAAASARREVLPKAGIFADPHSLYDAIAARRDEILQKRLCDRDHKSKAAKHSSAARRRANRKLSTPMK